LPQRQMRVWAEPSAATAARASAMINWYFMDWLLAPT
jgi:hypothetical protein